MAILSDELIGRRLQTVVEKLCGGSWTPLLTHLVHAEKLTAAQRQELRDLIDDLDKRVLVLVAEGLTDPEIASRIGLDAEDVTRRVSALLEKLGIRSGTPTGPRD